MRNASRAGGQSQVDRREPIRCADLAADVLGFLRNADENAQRMPVVRFGERAEINPELRKLIHFRDRWRCQWCGWWPWGRCIGDEDRMLQLDHVIPWSAGGSDRSDNLRTLCSRCNERRGNRRADLEITAPLPVVHCCGPCLLRDDVYEDDELRPDPAMPGDALAVFCGRRKHVSWSRDGWRIL